MRRILATAERTVGVKLAYNSLVVHTGTELFISAGSHAVSIRLTGHERLMATIAKTGENVIALPIIAIGIHRTGY
jgi:hypothetical protein